MEQRLFFIGLLKKKDFIDAWLDVRGLLLLGRLIGWREVEEGRCGLPILSTFSLHCPPNHYCLHRQFTHTAGWKTPSAPKMELTKTTLVVFSVWKVAGLLAENVANATDTICQNLCFWKSTLYALVQLSVWNELAVRNLLLLFLPNPLPPVLCWSRSALAAAIMMTHIGNYGFDPGNRALVRCTNSI